MSACVCIVVVCVRIDCLLFCTAVTSSSGTINDMVDDKATEEGNTVNSSKVSSSFYCSHVICSVRYLGNGQSSTSW